MATNDADDDGSVSPFAGLTRYSAVDESQLPADAMDYGSAMKWWAVARSGVEDADERDLPEHGFTTTVNRLPRASSADVAWRHPLTEEWVATSKHNAIIEPDRAEQMQQDNPEHFGTAAGAREFDFDPQDVTVGDEVLFHIPTSDYTIINPAQALMPLAEVLSEEEGLGPVFGEFRVTRGGGRLSGDILFNGREVSWPGQEPDRKPTVVGLEICNDFFGDQSFRARGISMDGRCVNTMRGLTEWEIIKHTGDVDERVDWHDWWRDRLEEIDLLADQLTQVIQEAAETTLDLSEFPEDFVREEHDTILEALFDYMGLPRGQDGYLARAAAENVRAEASDPFAPSWWEIHRGATYAITHHHRGENMGGGAVDRHNQIANDALMNPAGMEQRVQTAYQTRVDEDDGELVEEGGGSAQIAEAFASAREKREEYEQRQERIRQMAVADQ